MGLVEGVQGVEVDDSDEKGTSKWWASARDGETEMR